MRAHMSACVSMRLCVCPWVDECVRMRAPRSVCVCMCVCARACTRVCVCIGVCVCKCLLVHRRANMCLLVHRRANMCVRAKVCQYACAHARTMQENSMHTRRQLAQMHTRRLTLPSLILQPDPASVRARACLGRGHIFCTRPPQRVRPRKPAALQRLFHNAGAQV